MILTLDVGNTQITGGLFEDDKLVLQFRRTTAVGNSSDEIGLFLRSVIRENGFHWQKIDRIGICSVVPSINYSISSALSKYFNQEALFIQAGIKTGLKLKYSNPREIGADRIAGAIGAVSLHPDKDLIIIDMGTATTIDCVTKDREYLGGAILSGLKISVEALANGTAKLPSVEISKPGHICGTNTVEAIQSGLYYGNAGALKEFCRLYQKNIFKDEKPFIIGTGGFARIFEEYSLFDEVSPELVLLGVKKALEMNS
ncbi:MAG: type III pantothenate kinase [Treponema sp.]|nr:type III pantothenate kinase [Treponema sp.]